MAPMVSRVEPENYSPRATPPATAVNKLWRSLSGGRFGLGRNFGLGLGLGANFLPLQIGRPAFPFLSFVVLLAHITLYIRDAFRLFSAL